MLMEVAPGQTVTAKPVSGKIQVGAMAPVVGPVRLVPKASAAPNYAAYRGRSYRGEMELVLGRTGRLSVVNVVNLEEYLLGVVPNEMSPSWPAEALKAQAVAARTYAEANRGKQKADGFDLRNNTDDQAYGGVNAEQPSTTSAVQATRGQVITYQGQLVATYYHSSSGGHTENNENYWSGVPRPYLRGVPDYDNVPDHGKVKGNPYYAWSLQFTPEEFAQKLKLAGYDVGQVKGVTPGPLGAGNARPIRWMISGSGGEALLTMSQMRTALGLRAGPRSVELRLEKVAMAPVAPPPQAAPVHVVGAGGRVVSRPVEGSYVVGAGGRVIQRPAGLAAALGALLSTSVGKVPPPPPPPPPVPPTVIGFEVTGGGYGHGIGMSQWGAHGMALQGKTYAQILTHFYSGTKVETR